MASSVPPHSRGWSPAAIQGGGWRSGSPALAGMVRRSTSATARRSWFPRTRGDGPTSHVGSESSGSVPPHSRGWSLRDLGQAADPSGSPALAGMVPQSGRSDRSVSWFPRTRGDGPWPVVVRACPLRVPPHSRGWSRFRLGLPHFPRGSPALAGMVPRTPCSMGPASRFPRTRGDGPVRAHVFGMRKMIPPQTRGHSPRRSTVRTHHAGR